MTKSAKFRSNEVRMQFKNKKAPKIRYLLLCKTSTLSSRTTRSLEKLLQVKVTWDYPYLIPFPFTATRNTLNSIKVITCGIQYNRDWPNFLVG